MLRRDFLARTGLVFGSALAARAGLAPAAAAPPSAGPAPDPNLADWAAVRAQFNLRRDVVPMAGFYLASHPTPVREAIERHRRALDNDPFGYHHHGKGAANELRVLDAGASYFGVSRDDIALTDSTTMGLGLLYGALELGAGQEVLSTTHDHYSTNRSLELRAERTGAKVRRITLYDVPGSGADADQIVDRLVAGVTPATRVVAVTWVHSGTGVKLPIRRMADALARINQARAEQDRIILCVDGVHAVGIENVSLSDLGCDYLVAGAHKWLFGPRGTGFIWGRPEAHQISRAVIPPFSPVFFADVPEGEPEPESSWGMRMSPGGFHSFEHRWALEEAFRFHERIGKARVERRIHDQNRMMKEGLAGMKGVTLHTPMSEELSAGIVCFEVAGLTPEQAVAKLTEKGIQASTTPYDVEYARLAPSLLTTPEDVETCLRAVRALV